MIVWSTADFYGASYLVGARSKYYPTMPNVSWTHGCIFGDNPEWPIFLSKHESYFSKHLVTNYEQKEALEFLNKDVVAVGLPFAYAHRRFYRNNVVRTINRLYVPSHSIATQSLHSNVDQLINSAVKKGCDYILLNSYDYNLLVRNKDFIANQLADKLKFIRGADITDKVCLERMVNIFQASKTIVTDTVGSHLYYATLCGCNVSIVDLKRPTFQSYQNVLSKMVNPWHDAFVKYFRMISNGDELVNQVSCFTQLSSIDYCLDQSRHMVGIDSMVSDDKIFNHLSNFNYSQKKKISQNTYLLLRKLRLVKDY